MTVPIWLTLCFLWFITVSSAEGGWGSIGHRQIQVLLPCFKGPRSSCPRRPMCSGGNAFQTLKGLWGFVFFISSSSFPFGSSLFTGDIMRCELSTDIYMKACLREHNTGKESEDDVKRGLYLRAGHMTWYHHCRFEAPYLSPCLAIHFPYTLTRGGKASVMQGHHLRRFSAIQSQYEAIAYPRHAPN